MHRPVSLRRLALLPVALLSAIPAFAEEDYGPAILSPEQIGQIYCLGSLGNDMTPVEALLTESLTEAIDEAWTKNDAWAAVNPPDEKPPLGDGVPWRAWQDYAPECTVASASRETDEARVRLDYAFPDYPDADYTDTLHLRLVPGPSGWNVWRIDNVGFATGGNLRSSLVSVFEEH